MVARLAAMEVWMKKEEEGVKTREEIRMLRDRVEQREWANSQFGGRGNWEGRMRIGGGKNGSEGEGPGKE